jgi:hypothetical protein
MGSVLGKSSPVGPEAHRRDILRDRRTAADYRELPFHFSQIKTREEAKRFAEQVIADRGLPAERRLGSPTDDDIRRALDEVFPVFDGSGDIARPRDIA